MDASDQTQGSKLSGKVALITGAGHGIGKACALAYAREGASLVLIGRSGAVSDAAARIRELGRPALPVLADVSKAEDVRAAARSAIQEYGRIDILVNNAGHQGPGAPIWEVDPDAWRQTVDVNLWGTFLFCREVIPSMVARGSGRVINVSSGAGNHPMPFFSGYSASKAAVTHFTRTIAEELKPFGVTANAVGVRGITRMWRDVLDAGPGGGTTTATILAQYQEGMRPEVEENMPVLLFLASDDSRHLTGQYLEANSLPSYLSSRNSTTG
jgi:NAD(P)-dependent dehydrogenase (short-subunit alcohol dehydrogenase family)